MTVMFERSTEMEWSVVKQRLNTNRKKETKRQKTKTITMSTKCKPRYSIQPFFLEDKKKDSMYYNIFIINNHWQDFVNRNTI